MPHCCSSAEKGERCTVEDCVESKLRCPRSEIYNQNLADCCFLFHRSDRPLFSESGENDLLFFVVLCELNMLNKVLQHLISLLLDTPLPEVVVP